MNKMLVVECSHDLWLDVIEKLTIDYKLDPFYWVISKRYQNIENLKSRFSNTIFHNNYDAVKGIPDASHADQYFPIPDADLINQFKGVESIVIKMMDRMDPLGVFTHQDRIRLYYDYLAYWNFILKEYRPDLFVTSAVPHLCYDFVIYELCKHYGIKTIMLCNTPVAGRLFVTADFTKNFFNGQLENGEKPIAISDNVKEYLEKVRSTYEKALPNYMVNQIQNKKKRRKLNEGLIKQTIKYLKSIRHKYITKWYQEPVETYFKFEGKGIKSEITRGELLNYSDKVRSKTRLLEREYRRIAHTTVKTEKPFIYVGLMYQPERSSSPEGGIFENQYIMIEWLSELVPSNYQIYVKEHPSQFLFDNIQTREIWFYDKLNRLSNVTFISTDYNSFELIDRSVAVATLTGTVGFEAFCRLKPVLCFGYAWYRGAKGIHSIQTKTDLKYALEAINEGVSQENVNHFIDELEKRTFQGYTEDLFKPADLTYEENIENISRVINQFYIS